MTIDQLIGTHSSTLPVLPFEVVLNILDEVKEECEAYINDGARLTISHQRQPQCHSRKALIQVSSTCKALRDCLKSYLFSSARCFSQVSLHRLHALLKRNPDLIHCITSLHIRQSGSAAGSSSWHDEVGWGTAPYTDYWITKDPILPEVLSLLAPALTELKVELSDVPRLRWFSFQGHIRHALQSIITHGHLRTLWLKDLEVSPELLHGIPESLEALHLSGITLPQHTIAAHSQTLADLTSTTAVQLPTSNDESSSKSLPVSKLRTLGIWRSPEVAGWIFHHNLRRMEFPDLETLKLNSYILTELEVQTVKKLAQYNPSLRRLSFGLMPRMIDLIDLDTLCGEGPIREVESFWHGQHMGPIPGSIVDLLRRVRLPSNLEALSVSVVSIPNNMNQGNVAETLTNGNWADLAEELSKKDIFPKLKRLVVSFEAVRSRLTSASALVVKSMIGESLKSIRSRGDIEISFIL